VELIEELLAQYVIPLDPRTKKNHMSIVGTGPKCTKCGKRKKQFVRQGRAHDKFAFDAARFLILRPKEPISTEVHLVYRLYMQTKRKVDDLNLYASRMTFLSTREFWQMTTSDTSGTETAAGCFMTKRIQGQKFISTDMRRESNWQQITEQKCLLWTSFWASMSQETATPN
jgi:hypothetical protein